MTGGSNQSPFREVLKFAVEFLSSPELNIGYAKVAAAIRAIQNSEEEQAQMEAERFQLVCESREEILRFLRPVTVSDSSIAHFHPRRTNDD